MLVASPASAQSAGDGDGFGAVPTVFVAPEAGVRVIVDGRDEGTTRADGTLAVPLGMGTHEVRFEAEGYEASVQTFEVDRTSPLVTARMVPVVPPPNPLIPILIALLAACSTLAVGLALAIRRKRTSLQFDRYRVLRPIGRGGMATVFLARDRHRDVALKVMDPGLLGDGDLVRKFLKEGEVLQIIEAHDPTSPVVRALSYGRENGSEDGRPFVALEYIPGQTLLTFFRERGALPARPVLGIARQVCEGLAAAHAQGVWHRDVSPDNVLLDGPPRSLVPAVKLIDFGVAKHEYTQAKTLDGSISGKPAYMSPEQCQGAALDGRSDLYSVGVMMYTMLAGRPPFEHTNPLLVMRQHETAAVPPLPESVPAPVRALVMRLLAKDPNARPASATEVAAELSALERTN